MVAFAPDSRKLAAGLAEGKVKVSAVPSRKKLATFQAHAGAVLGLQFSPKGEYLATAGQDKLAGSALRLDHGVENLMKLANLTLAQAAQMATVNAAKAGKIAGRQQGLAPGERSDFVIFQFDEPAKRITVEETWVSGEKVFQR